MSAHFGLTQPVLGDANGRQYRPVSAFDGTNHLVVWVDSRQLVGVRDGIWGARVSETGSLLDPGGIEIFPYGVADGVPPGIAFDGTNFMVVAIHSNGEIRAKRVSPGGQVLDSSQGLLIGTSSYHRRHVALGVGTNRYLVVWLQSSPGTVYGRLIDTSGTPIGPPFSIANGGDAISPRVAFANGTFLVVRENGYGVEGIRVDETGAVLDVPPILFDYTSSAPAVGSDGNQFLVAWSYGSTSGLMREVRARRVGVDGSLPEATPRVLSPTSGTSDSSTVSFDGQNFVVAWDRYDYSGGPRHEMMANRVSPAGSVLDGSGVSVVGLLPEQSAFPTSSCAAASCLVAWHSWRRQGSTEILGGRIQQGTPLDTAAIHVSAAATEQRNPSSAFVGGQHLVVWEEARVDDEADVHGARVAADGTVLDPLGIVISAAPRNQSRPRVAASSSDFLVVWSDGRGFTGQTSDAEDDVFAARVSFAGAVLDPAGIRITNTRLGTRPAVASDGTNFLVAWEEGTGSPAYDKIQAARIDGTTGGILDALPLELTPARGGGWPAIGFGGGQYLVTWNHVNDVRALRIHPDGTLIDPVPGFVVAVGSYPSVTFDGQQFVVAYRRYDSARGEYRMFVSRVTGAGTVLDPSGILVSTSGINSPGSGDWRAAPQVTFDGRDTLIAWPNAFYSTQIEGVWMRPNGTLFGQTVLANLSPSLALAPTVSGQGDEMRALLAYSFGNRAPGISNPRVDASIVTFRVNGQSCTLDSDCKSGFCADQVCCDSRCGNGAATDCQACSVAAGAAQDGVCGPVAAGTICRESSGSCDVPESCDGTTLTCPANGFAAVGVVCRAAAGPCDAAEVCTGTAPSCPADKVVANGTVCRSAAGACDVAELCDGTGKECPADAKKPGSTICRVAAGPCDLAETCSGADDDCPPDAYHAAGVVCREASGPCDTAEVCTGDGGACPADAFLGPGFVCRAASGACDVAEHCTGGHAACPADTVVAAGVVCRAAAGACDTAEFCDGTHGQCPDDALAAPGVICRDARGECDVPESCTGTDVDCPADVLAAAGVTCRERAGACDLEESCTGVDAACPVDAFVVAGTVCRESAGACDVAESCSGMGAACPVDSFVVAGTTCRESAGPCDVEESCTGVDATCPADAFVAAGVTCREKAGACDAEERCTGVGAACPPDVVVDAGTICRGPTGPCDVAERCSGDSAICPTDESHEDGTPCDDGDGCTVGDACHAGVCRGQNTCSGGAGGGGGGTGGSAGAGGFDAGKESEVKEAGGCGCATGEGSIDALLVLAFATLLFRRGARP